MLACNTTGGLGASNPARALVALVACLCGLGLFTGKSSAGTYTAAECASWSTYSEAQYSESGHHMLAIYRDCGGGGSGLGMALPQNYLSGYGSEARFQLNAPVGTHFTSVSFIQRGQSADGWYQNVIACGPFGCSDAGPGDGGVWRGIAVPAGNYTTWLARLYCLNGGGCYGSPQAGLFVRDITMSVSDDAPPNVHEAGDLVNQQVQRGVGRLDVSATDDGSGLTSDWVLVNDQEVARQSYACGGRPLQPCPTNGATLHFDLDTQSSPFHDGHNTVQACASDFGAPPNVSCTARQDIDVDNSCTPSSVPGGSNLTAVFPRTGNDTVDVKAGQGAGLTGQLTDRSGDPIARATICVQEGVAGQGVDSVGTETTNSNGRYTYGVAPGPDRNVRVGYRFNRDQLQHTARFNSRLAAKLRLSKRVLKNGHGLKLFGSIPGPNNSSRVVILQARYPHSKRWNTFDKAKTDATGLYVLRYRFTSTFVTTNYRMRAVVPEQNGYPYEGGASRPKKIKVIGRTPHGHHL